MPGREKFCRGCEQSKAAEDFQRDKSKKDGLSTRCRVCRKAQCKAAYERDKEARRERQRQYYYANREAEVERSRRWRRENLEKHRREGFKRATEWRRKHPDRARETYRKWYAKNRGVGAAYTARRRQRMQTKIADAFRAETTRVYRTCPKGGQVDHIVPLIHDRVCGLHVPWNLTHMSRERNRAKSNRFDPRRWPEQGRLATDVMDRMQWGKRGS